jgi:hypothetical protein
MKSESVPHAHRGNGFNYLRIFCSLESGKWYARDQEDREVAHGFDTATELVRAVEHAYNTPPYEPKKYT